METHSFEDLGLRGEVLNAIAAKGFETPSPIQELAIPRLLTSNVNLIARARTGTGKTAAFGLPIVQTLCEEGSRTEKTPRALVLAPTRELAIQVSNEITSFSTGSYPRVTTVYGGAPMSQQLRALRNGTEIVVGTPGRIKDHLERKTLDLSHLDFFILDEADEMLDMGFIEDIESIFSTANTASRVLMFSATMPPAILRIAKKFMGEFEIIQEEVEESEPVLTHQEYYVVRESDKTEALIRIIDSTDDFYGLIFCQTKVDADAVARNLDERGYQAAALHGDIAQNQREKILNRFRAKKTRVLVATDVAARGIDIEGLTHVINYALPNDSATYVHRIGRTGRAGAKGIAISFIRPEERRRIRNFQGLTQGTLEEGKIPDITDVIAMRRNRLFNRITTSVGHYFDQDDEISAQPIPDQFKTLAENLTENRSPLELSAALLSVCYGKELDPERYGDIQPITARSERGGRFERDGGRFDREGSRDGRSRDRGRKNIPVPPGQTRLYLGLGRNDNMTRRDIAEFFADLLNIPQRLVDNIDLADSFSLATLPAAAAAKALEMSKHQRGLPHMHVDINAAPSAGADLYRKPRFSDGDETGGSANRSHGKGHVRGFNDRKRDKSYRDDRPVGTSIRKRNTSTLRSSAGRKRSFASDSE